MSLRPAVVVKEEKKYPNGPRRPRKPVPQPWKDINKKLFQAKSDMMVMANLKKPTPENKPNKRKLEVVDREEQLPRSTFIVNSKGTTNQHKSP